MERRDRGAIGTNRFYLLTPSSEAKRQAYVVSHLPQCSPFHADVDGKEAECLTEHLLQRREFALSNLHGLVDQLEATAQESAEMEVCYAETAQAAISYIAAVAQDTPYIGVNKSTVLVDEVIPGLRQLGLQVIDTYFNEFDSASSRFSSYWQIPPIDKRWVMNALLKTEIVELKDAERRDMVSVLGLNAIGAQDASAFFLQHMRNISKLLTLGKEIVLVAALDKIVPTREDALFQTYCMGIFGIENVLMSLQSKDTGARWEEIPAAPQGRMPKVHLILLDNGRSQLVKGPYKSLLQCIGCRACTIQCPMYRYFGGPTRMSPRQYLFLYLLGQNQSLELCTSCHMCYVECPLSIDIPGLIQRAKRESKRGRLIGPRNLLLANPDRLGRTIAPLAPLANMTVKVRPARFIMEKGIGIERQRILPTYYGDTAPKIIKKMSAPSARKVAYFAGCWATYNAPDITEGMVEVMKENGIEVVYPDQCCCGLPSTANDVYSQVLDHARYNTRALLAAIDKGYEVVLSCPSCGLMLRKEYPNMIKPEEAQRLQQHCFHYSEYLLKLHQEGEFNTQLGTVYDRVLFQTPCHLKALGLGESVRKALSLIPGMTVDDIGRGCCGMGGTFGWKTPHYQQSMEVGRPMAEVLAEHGSAIPSTDCGACGIQIEQTCGCSATHPLVILQQAYRRAKDALLIEAYDGDKGNLGPS